MDDGSGAALPLDQLDAAVTVLDLVRDGRALTRPELVRASGLGRNVVAQRVAHLVQCGLLEGGELARSTGGRAPRELRFRAEAGHVLVAELGATSTSVALADLSGRLLAHRDEPSDVTDGPEIVLRRVDELLRAVLTEWDGTPEVWGVGIGVPGPVEFATGRPVSPPIMPGWDGFDVRGYFAERYRAPVWVDNDVNVMVLGELRAGLAQGENDVVYVKVGTGIGAGLVSQGRLHRGAQGCAGDIGHVATAEESVICRCGKPGCLEAVAGGAALGRDGAAAARDGRSPFLASVLNTHGTVLASDVGRGASHGDPVSVQLLVHSAHVVGEALASIVNFFNPSLILIGGGVASSGDLYLAEIRQVILGRSLPLATRSLQVVRSPPDDRAGLRGAAFMVIDELLSRDLLARWLPFGSPAGRAALTA